MKKLLLIPMVMATLSSVALATNSTAVKVAAAMASVPQKQAIFGGETNTTIIIAGVAVVVYLIYKNR
jgi:hypothetical protein